MNTSIGCPVCGYVSRSIDDVRRHLEDSVGDPKHQKFDHAHQKH
ncbi:hypothetical protein BH09PAT2_BH09PAT2_08210 [soil metagenome]